jgi:hypothetical protein
VAPLRRRAEPRTHDRRASLRADRASWGSHVAPWVRAWWPPIDEDDAPLVVAPIEPRSTTPIWIGGAAASCLAIAPPQPSKTAAENATL